jgi:NADPH-dependent curcumin reductase CurA
MAVQVGTHNRRVTMASRPTGFPTEADFAVEESEVDDPGPSELLVRNLWVSVDPYQRGRMSTQRSYAKGLEIGDVMTAQAVGEVVESNDPRYSPGELVIGQLGWQDYAVTRAGSVRRVPDFLDPPTLALHAVGATGFTAYFGLLDVGRPKPGDTVVVSGAAGAVGQIVGQIAKIAGCRTVGIAGGPEKRKECTLHGYDLGIDYKGEDVRAALKEACPDGIDVFFDNVGGSILQAAVSRLNIGARIVICGQISQYNLERHEPTFAPGALIVYRARMEGFLVTDYVHRYEEAAVRLARWVAEGKIRWTEHVTEGLENAPKAFIGMLNGENRGKALVKVADRSEGS